MKVILKQDVPNLGLRREVKEVADGFARNYLIPKGLAVRATKEAWRQLEDEEKRIERIAIREKEEAEQLAEKINKLSLTIPRPAGADDRLFGAVTTQDIAEALAEHEIEIDRRKIELPQPLRAIGIYSVPIRLHKEVEAHLKVWVIKEE
jgi:large subunit ribosomal protein L9